MILSTDPHWLAKTSKVMGENRWDLINQAKALNESEADPDTGVLSASAQASFDSLITAAQKLTPWVELPTDPAALRSFIENDGLGERARQPKIGPGFSSYTPVFSGPERPCRLTPDSDGRAESDEGVEEFATEGEFGGLIFDGSVLEPLAEGALEPAHGGLD